MNLRLTEAYEGARISAKMKVSSPNAKGVNSVYDRAHNKATSQPLIKRRMFDNKGKMTDNVEMAKKVVWYVKPNEMSDYENIIQELE